MRISVFGLGYVGTVSAAYFASRGHSVLGVDSKQAKVDIINKGQASILEHGLEPLIAGSIKSGKLKATTDAKEAILNSSITFICVGTPSLANGSPDLTYFKKVAKEVGCALRNKEGYHIIVVRSTVLPNTTEGIFIPVVEKYAKKKNGLQFGVVFNPEFLRESSALHDFCNPAYTIIGASNRNDYRTVALLYKDIKAPLIMVPIKVAEMIKYANNTFHALKITFANEISSICRVLEIDPFEVMKIFCLDKKLNISSCYFRPGFAFGGACLPKDVRAITYMAKTFDINALVLNQILQSNALLVKYALDRIIAMKKKRIGVLGIAFKAGTDDLRESPTVELVEALLGKGYSVAIFDRNVTLTHLHGANKEFIERKIPHIGRLMVKNIGEILDNCEIIVIGNSDKHFADIFPLLNKKQYVLDLVGVARKIKTKAHYEGLSW